MCCWSFGIDESDATFTHPFAFMCVFLLQMSFFAMYVCVDFDAPATGKWYQIERRRIVFLCWMHDSNPRSLEPNLLQTKCPMKNQLSYRGSNKNFEINSSSLWSASIQPTRPHYRYGFTPGPQCPEMSAFMKLQMAYCLFFSRWTSNKTLRKIL